MSFTSRVCRAGLIPAHAGKTRLAAWHPSRHWAHPRSRGENNCESMTVAKVGGSSPLTRGKLDRALVAGGDRRLIPAHAGKTLTSYAATIVAWAHPRSRGENSDVAVNGQTVRGSSPLTRGKRRPMSLPRPFHGLIPAHAGKTCRERRTQSQRWAHPRSRGENRWRRRRWEGSRGSSPLTRGKPGRGRERSCGSGLIPAHAGKTARPGTSDGGRGAHPRSRGENYSRSPRVSAFMGSSPLTRGKRPSCADDRLDLGLIPAHAGKTPQVSRPWR